MYICESCFDISSYYLKIICRDVAQDYLCDFCLGGLAEGYHLYPPINWAGGWKQTTFSRIFNTSYFIMLGILRE